MKNMVGFDIKDAQELQRQLGSFSEKVEDEWNKLIREWEQLKECWGDRQYNRFEPYFQILSERYQQALTECNDYRAFLVGKINETNKAPTIGEGLETVITVVGAFSSLLGGGAPPVQNVHSISPATSYVQTIPPQKDPLCSSAEVDKQQELAVQEFEAEPEFMRPMKLEDQLEEVYDKDEEAKRGSLRREADILSDR